MTVKGIRYLLAAVAPLGLMACAVSPASNPAVSQAKVVGIASNMPAGRANKITVGTTVFTNESSVVSVPGLDLIGGIERQLRPGLSPRSVPFPPAKKGFAGAMAAAYSPIPAKVPPRTDCDIILLLDGTPLTPVEATTTPPLAPTSRVTPIAVVSSCRKASSSAQKWIAPQAVSSQWLSLMQRPDRESTTLSFQNSKRSRKINPSRQPSSAPPPKPQHAPPMLQASALAQPPNRTPKRNHPLRTQMLNSKPTSRLPTRSSPTTWPKSKPT